MTTVPLPQPLLTTARTYDANDSLSAYRDMFYIPDGVVYLDGNSLGVLPKSVAEAVHHTVTQQWGNGLIRSWNDAGWIDAPTRIGDGLAQVLGADTGEIVITDTISINLFKTICYALSMTAKKTVLVEGGTFPSDIYVTQGVVRLHNGVRIKTVPNMDTGTEADIFAYLTDDIGVAVLSDVNYKTARVLDTAKINAYAKRHGIIIIWDLAHSAGALDIDLKRDGAEMAVGCTYKYLNAGPGAPAFVYVDKALQGKGTQPIQGWFSHANMFAMSADYTPSADIRQFQTGTFSPIAYAALEQSIKIWQKVDMAQVRAKSLALTDWFLSCMDPIISEYGFDCITPIHHHRRGSHIALTAPTHAYAIVQALIARGVIGDFRHPNVMRFGFAPLYLSFEQVARASLHFQAVMDNAEYKNPAFQTRAVVT